MSALKRLPLVAALAAVAGRARPRARARQHQARDAGPGQLDVAQGAARHGRRLGHQDERPRQAARLCRRHAGQRIGDDQDDAAGRRSAAGESPDGRRAWRRSTTRSACSACRSSSRATRRPPTCSRSSRRCIEKRLDAKGFHLLCWGSGGWVQIFSKKPIKTLDELKQAKLYTSEGDDKMVQWYKTNGFHPVALLGQRHPGAAEAHARA